jgi:hypothetical protein
VRAKQAPEGVESKARAGGRAKAAAHVHAHAVALVLEARAHLAHKVFVGLALGDEASRVVDALAKLELVRVKAPAQLPRVRHDARRRRCGRLEVRVDRVDRPLACEHSLVIVAPEVREHLA